VDCCYLTLPVGWMPAITQTPSAEGTAWLSLSKEMWLSAVLFLTAVFLNSYWSLYIMSLWPTKYWKNTTACLRHQSQTGWHKTVETCTGDFWEWRKLFISKCLIIAHYLILFEMKKNHSHRGTIWNCGLGFAVALGKVVLITSLISKHHQNALSRLYSCYISVTTVV